METWFRKKIKKQLASALILCGTIYELALKETFFDHVGLINNLPDNVFVEKTKICLVYYYCGVAL